jgi:hypothetical protein
VLSRASASAMPATSWAASSGSRRTVATQASDFHVLSTRKPPSVCAETRTPRPPPRWSSTQVPGDCSGIVMSGL